MSNKEKYKLICGCHNGTWASRDIGHPYYHDTYEDCINTLEKIQKNLKRFGSKLWFAEIIDPEGKCVFYNRGEPYE